MDVWETCDRQTWQVWGWQWLGQKGTCSVDVCFRYVFSQCTFQVCVQSMNASGVCSVDVRFRCVFSRRTLQVCVQWMHASQSARPGSHRVSEMGSSSLSGGSVQLRHPVHPSTVLTAELQSASSFFYTKPSADTYFIPSSPGHTPEGLHGSSNGTSLR